jgi:precorrin-2/cobalt-factor-2 C20-methyltransferase
MRKGRLFAVGVGPGDPELITLKALRLIEDADVVFVPKGRKAGESLALSIAEQVADVKGKRVEEVHFPMQKGSQREALLPEAKRLLGILEGGANVVFLTLGDPLLYSTFFHLYDAIMSLDKDVRIEIVPGVTSVTAAAAGAGVNLALSEEKVAVLPAVYIKDLRQVLEKFETVVLMKVHSVLDQVKGTLREMGLLENAHYVARVGLPGEVVKPLGEVLPEDLNYFSVVIVRNENV